MSGITPTDAEGTPAPPAPEAPNPWNRWQEAGFNPETNPFELAQHMAYLDELRHPDTHESALERGLRDWGHLQEGESLEDFRLAMDLIRAEREDPFGIAPPPPADFGDDDGEADGVQYIDPNRMREVMREDFQKMLEEHDQRSYQQREAERLAANLTSQRSSLESSLKDALGDRAGTAAGLAFDRAIHLLQTQKADPAKLDTLVKDAWGEMEAVRQAELGAQVAAMAAPTTIAPTGAAPAAIATAQQNGPRGIEAAVLRTAQRLGIDPSQLD